MTSVIYELTEEKYLLHEDTRVSYGITAYDASELGETPAIVAVVHDISSDKEKLFELVDFCNRLELSVIHLYDVVEDFLAD